MTLYTAWNTARPTTAARAGVTTGTAIKTMLQIATPATQKLKVVRWGVIALSAPTAVVRCELIDVDVAATVTAHIAAGVQPYGDAGAPASAMTLGTTATGYTATAEGAVTASRTGDETSLAIGQSSYQYEWSLGREFDLAVSRFLRVRCTTATAVDLLTWITWDE